MARVLIIGGTGEARRLAGLLTARGHAVTTSLAGTTANPLLPEGEVRVGGFGGEAGLIAHLRTGHIDLLADASHPFAARISAHAAAGAASLGIPYVRLERPEWRPRQGDRWTSARDLGEAAHALDPGAVAFLAVGRGGLSHFTGRRDITAVARMIEPPGIDVPEGWRIVLARPPFSVADETALLREARITVLVVKNSGGEEGAAKLAAARTLGLPVIMVRRPMKPQAPIAETPQEMLALIGRVVGQK